LPGLQTEGSQEDFALPSLRLVYERVKGAWEERFERSYGFWRGLVDEVVNGYLACGLWQGGFGCRRCPEEFLVAFSC
jgi:hypothetical protein